MVSMEGVPSSLILRNESWVRKHASALARRLPSNVERADLIQVGLIAVAQAALGFKWEGDRESPEAREAFVRYARQRVHGAMLDELRQMDQLSRERRRQVKLVQVARERWLSEHGSEPTVSDLAPLCGRTIDEATLEKVASITGGKYFRATDTDSLKNIYAEIDKLEKTKVEAQHFVDYRELAVQSYKAGRITVPPLLLVAFVLLTADDTRSQVIGGTMTLLGLLGAAAVWILHWVLITHEREMAALRELVRRAN